MNVERYLMRDAKIIVRRSRFAGLVVVAVAVAALHSQAQGPGGLSANGGAPTSATPLIATAPSTAAPASEGNDGSTTRLREGTQLTDRMGYFRQNGDALTFVDADGRELGGLPNLSLERIIRMLKSVEEPEGVKWSVSGTVTEFSGRNYLLVSRAVYKAAMLPPMPDAVP
jgi:hypothetical protein